MDRLTGRLEHPGSSELLIAVDNDDEAVSLVLENLDEIELVRVAIDLAETVRYLQRHLLAERERVTTLEAENVTLRAALERE